MTYRRVDDNQTEIVTALRDMGVSVQILSEVGKGCPDLLLGWRGRNYLAEVKDGKKWLSAQRLTILEQKFFDNWRGQVTILNSVEAAVQFIQSLEI